MFSGTSWNFCTSNDGKICSECTALCTHKSSGFRLLIPTYNSSGDNGFNDRQYCTKKKYTKKHRKAKCKRRKSKKLSKTHSPCKRDAKVSVSPIQLLDGIDRLRVSQKLYEKIKMLRNRISTGQSKESSIKFFVQTQGSGFNNSPDNSFLKSCNMYLEMGVEDDPGPNDKTCYVRYDHGNKSLCVSEI